MRLKRFQEKYAAVPRPKPRSNKVMAVMLCALLAGPILLAGPALAQPAHAPFTLTSPAFTDGAVIPDRFSQSPGNPPANWGTSPELHWAGAPAGTQSFVILLHDLNPAINHSAMDVTHWMAFNIPGTATSLPEGVPTQPTLADGTVQIRNTRNHTGFMGPGAPPGLYHHYVFALYALDTKLNLGPDATRAQVTAAMDGHVLGKAVLTGLWRRGP